jgi:hypothetical protein
MIGATFRATIRALSIVALVLVGIALRNPVITMVSQSTITAPGGTAQFVISIDQEPGDLQLTAAVYPRLSDAVTAMDDALRGSFVGDPFRPVLERPLRTLVDDAGDVRIELPTSTVDEPERLRLRDSGVYPVRITVHDSGEPVAQLVTFITRADPTTLRPLEIALVADGGNDALRQPDGRVDATNFEPLGTIADFATTSGIPVTFVIQPENVAALMSSGNSNLQGLAVRVAEAARSGQVIADTYVDVDPSTAVTDNWQSEYVRQRTLAAGALTTWLGRQYQDTGVRLLRRPQSDAGIELMRSTGMTALVGSDSLVDLPRSSIPVAPHTLKSESGASFTSLVIPADDLGAAFGVDSASDQTLSAARYRARLDHLALGSSARRGVAIPLNNRALDQTTLDVFGSALANHPLLRFTTVGGLINDVDKASAGALLEFRKFTAKSNNPGSGAAGTIALVRLDLDQLRSMTPNTPAGPEETFTLAASSVISDDLRNAYLQSAKAPFEVLRDAVRPPGGERITLTGGRGSFPLTIRSTLTDRNLKVRIRLSSPRASFPENDFTITLENGVWQKNIPIEAREGKYEILVEIYPPTGDRRLTTGSIDVQTLNIGGIGLAISVAALVLLVMWWIASARRRRRTEAISETNAPALSN